MINHEINKVYEEVMAYFDEIEDYNVQFIESLGLTAPFYFEKIISHWNIKDKIKFIEAPKGRCIRKSYGVFENIHIYQLCLNMKNEINGFIYANVKGQWIEIPISVK